MGLSPKNTYTRSSFSNSPRYCVRILFEGSICSYCKRVASAVVDPAREIRLLSRQWSQSWNVPGQELVDAVDGIVADVREHVF